MGYLSLYDITRHIFSFSCMKPCDPVRRCPTVLSPPNQTPNAVLIITVQPPSRSDPIGGSEPKSGARDYLYTIYILYCTGTLIDLFFLRAVLVPVGIQRISVITKIILHIQKNYHRSGVHHNLYTYIKSHLLIQILIHVHS